MVDIDVTREFRTAMSQVVPEVVFKTQITPDFTFSLAPDAIAKGRPDKAPGITGKFAMWFLKNIIRPEIQVKAPEFGLEKTIAPWGRPQENLAFPLALGVAVGALGVGGFLYFWSRRKRR